MNDGQKQSRKGLVIYARCRTAEEKAELQRRAQKAELRDGRYLVECGLRTQNPPDPEERRLRETAVREVRRAGVNLNQIAHRLNQPSGVVSSAQIEAVLAALIEALELLSDAFWQPSEAQTEEM